MTVAGLRELGHDVKVVCPLYGSIKRDESWTPLGKPLCVPMGTGIRYARLTPHPKRPGSGPWYGNVEGVEQTCFLLMRRYITHTTQ